MYIIILFYLFSLLILFSKQSMLFFLKMFLCIKKYTPAVLSRKTPFLLFFYNKNDNSSCNSCDTYAEALHDLNIDVFTINYSEEKKVSFLFFVKLVPHFVIFDKKYYVLDASSVKELIRIVNSKEYLKYDPIPWYFYPDSTFMKFICIFNWELRVLEYCLCLFVIIFLIKGLADCIFNIKLEEDVQELKED